MHQVPIVPAPAAASCHLAATDQHTKPLKLAASVVQDESLIEKAKHAAQDAVESVKGSAKDTSVKKSEGPT
jgi:hypothetical protein